MTPKDNTIETVPLSAIRKVIELDAQDARELRAVAVELRDALVNTTQTLRLMLAGVTDYPAEARKEVRNEINLAEAVLQKAREIL